MSQKEAFPRKKRKHKKNIENKWGFGLLWQYLLHYTSQCANYIIKGAVLRPQKTMIILCAFLVLAVGIFSVNKLVLLSEKILPETVIVSVSNSLIQTRVRQTMGTLLESARQRKISRSTFMREAQQILEEDDTIESFWLRTGFDRKLQISIVSQIPALVLETQGNERYLISHSAKVISKLSHDAPSNGLVHLTVSDLKINATKKSRDKNLFKSTRYEYSISSLNMSWIIAQVKKIDSFVNPAVLNFSLEKLSWKTGTGFTLILKPIKIFPDPTFDLSKDAPPKFLNVLVGENQISQKLLKLSEILKDLTQRQLIPESIDLNFQDKAIIKVSGAILPNAL